MAEYVSKGVTGTALGLGIIGTVCLVNQLSNSCGGNFFEELNAIHLDHLDNDDILIMKNFYKTIYYIKSIKASMGK